MLTIFPSLISARDESVTQKVKAANVIEANNTVSSPSMINSIVTKIAKVNDIEVAYRIFGRGEPLFLVPGFSMTMDMWDPIVLYMLSSNHTLSFLTIVELEVLLQSLPEPARDSLAHRSEISLCGYIPLQKTYYKKGLSQY